MTVSAFLHPFPKKTTNHQIDNPFHTILLQKLLLESMPNVASSNRFVWLYKLPAKPCQPQEQRSDSRRAIGPKDDSFMLPAINRLPAGLSCHRG